MHRNDHRKETFDEQQIQLSVTKTVAMRMASAITRGLVIPLALLGTVKRHAHGADHGPRRSGEVHLDLTPSSAQLAAVHARRQAGRHGALTTDKAASTASNPGPDLPPEPRLHGLPARAGRGTVRRGRVHRRPQHQRRRQGHNTFKLIVQEAFSSTLVNGPRVRAELNRVGVWFADPKDDDFCLPGSAATPFDGDNEAGVQAFNSANAAPLPAP